MDSNKSQLEILAALDAAERLGVGGGLSRTELNTICVALRERLTPAPLSPDVEAAVDVDIYDFPPGCACPPRGQLFIRLEDYSVLRAVLAPKLTGEQMEAVKNARAALLEGMAEEEAEALEAAFPELGEVGG